tara:strand:+ start:509 stop:868 length:360 start_codon:yes stop_codon:yes gene_type:complete
MKSRQQNPLPLPPDLHPGAEPVPSTGVPAPHPGFNPLSEWLQSPPAPLPAGLTEAEVAQMWRQADQANARDISALKRRNARISALTAAISRLGDIAERVRSERMTFAHLTDLEVADAGR